MKPANTVLSGYGTSVFEVMSRLAMAHGAINLGQGFPEDDGPEDIRQVAADSLFAHSNQYPPMQGLAELRQAVADHGARLYGLTADPASEVLVTSGATQALAASLMGLIEPGDEVVMLEPLFDTYMPVVRRAGGVPRLVRLTPPDWRLPEAALRAAFSERTKLILLNTPMNPACKVFSRSELTLIADLVQQHDALAVCDEVYEHLVYDGLTHIPFNTLPGMFERTVKISSAGKMFSLTGWKIGLVTAQADLLVPVLKAHQFLTFTTPPNLQAAVALGLDKEDGYFDGLAARMQAGRDHLVAGFRGMGIATHDCAGTYFVNIDIGSTGFNGDDVAFCRHLTEAAKVAAIPVSAFCSETPITDTARFAFCKSTATLDAALDRMRAHFG
ncbi:MAG: aminotransferase [Alphaproteobacteria bacterium]